VSDERLRGLERRWLESGAVDDGARWLAERVRRGVLPAERVELAAHLGFPAAAASAGVELVRGFPAGLRAADGLLRLDELAVWARGLDRFGVEVRLRAAVADAGQHLAKALRGRRTDDRSDALLRFARAWWEAAAGWVHSPTNQVAMDRLDLLRRCTTPTDRADLERDEDLGQVLAATAGVRSSPAPAVGQWWPRAWLEPGGVDAPRLTAIHAAIGAALVPWALGLRDPLASLGDGALERLEPAARCPKAWADFVRTEDPGVRRCAACHLDVIDLARLPRAEVEARLDPARRTGGLCVTLYRRPDGRACTADCLDGVVRRWG